MRLPRIGLLGRSVIWAAVIYFGLLLVLAVQQRTLIYFPSRGSEEELVRIAASERMEPWRNPAGEIIGWRRPRPDGTEAENRLIVFHGNAGSALYRTHFVDGLEGIDGGRRWQVYLFEYPGYGARAGKPSEKTILASAKEAVDLLAGDGRPVYLLGESLGSGPACALAGSSPSTIAGLSLLTPFSSLVDVASFHYPYIPVRWVLSDRWDNVSNLGAYPGPVAVLLAEHDRITPADQGRRVYEVARGRKQLWVMPGVDHNGFNFSTTAPWWRELSDFLLQPRGI